MLRKLCWLSAFLAVLGFSVPEVAVFGVDSAYAQEKKRKRKNLFQLLFKRKNRAQRPDRQRRDALRRKLRLNNNKRRKRSKIAVVPVVPKVDKLETASKILVVGDFMADGTAWGLQQAFASDAEVVVVDKSSGLSGIVRDDVVNWPAKIPEHVAETKPIVVVVLVGMNDRQQMRTSTGKFNKLTEEWKKQYVARANALAKSTAGSKLVWLGLPPVKSSSMNKDYLVFNEIYRTAAESVGGVFVDVWDGYTNAEGKFISAGPDINGQIVRLRSSDGINMTKAGRRKLAFYADKAIRRITGLGTGELLAGLPDLNLPNQPLQPEYDPAKTGRTVVVSLEGPALDGGAVLEGADEFLKTTDGEKSVSHELVAKGSTSKPREGRIDAGWGLANPAPKKDADQAKEPKDQQASASSTPASGEAKPNSASQIEKKELPSVTNISN